MVEIPESRINHDLSEVDLALCRATLFGALALGFRSPTEETLARLASRESAATLAQAAALLEAGSDGGLTASVAGLTTAEGTAVRELSDSYLRLFGHTARGAVPPYETEYGTEALFQQPHELGDLMGFYEAFGLTLSTEEHERPDHLSCELEFLSFLALKEAYALERGEASMLEETRKATRLFLRDHLGRFLPGFANKLARQDPRGFYGRLGGLCYGFVMQECARFGIPRGPDNLSLRPADDNAVPMACGDGAGCMAMPGAGTPEVMED
ncbi:MAG: molecular chaperone TorD family protein [Deltaproteobacteria bacterium]|nr:molecular chaperone TorD family protein [Deltaproteobacteria bacterium]